MDGTAVEATGRRAVIISGALSTILGSGYVLLRWWPRRDGALDGILRCITLFCFVAAVHWVGYWVYRRQSTPSCRIMALDRFWPERIPQATAIQWTWIITQQSFALLFASIMLDGGTLLRSVLASSAVYWAMVVIGTFRCKGRPTPVDVVLMNIGLWPLLMLSCFAQYVVWGLKGLSP